MKVFPISTLPEQIAVDFTVKLIRSKIETNIKSRFFFVFFLYGSLHRLRFVNGPTIYTIFRRKFRGLRLQSVPYIQYQSFRTHFYQITENQRYDNHDILLFPTRIAIYLWRLDQNKNEKKMRPFFYHFQTI